MTEPGQTFPDALPESTHAVYYPALDGLRTIAVGMVFLVHMLPGIFPGGWLGVQIFFVLSGFLITGILFDTRDAAHRYRNFYVRRALRIFPLYYGVLLVCLAVVLLTHGHAPPFFWLWWVYLQNFFWLATHNTGSDVLVTGAGHGFAEIGHFWSLAVEEQFYLLWPPLVFLVRDRRRLMQLCCALIVFRLGLAVYWQGHLSAATLAGGVIYRMLPTQWDGFLLGGLLALWQRGNPSAATMKHSGRNAAIFLPLFAALLIMLYLRPALIGDQNVFDYTSKIQALFGLPLSNLASAALLLAVLQPSTWAYRLCALAPMRSLGRVSYGLYVFHLPVFVLTGGRLMAFAHHWQAGWVEPLIHFVVATLLTVALSYASFYWYEKPLLRLKDRFTAIKRQT